jgi:hypothetical protein
MGDELILMVRGSWVPLGNFQAAVGRIIATGLTFVPADEQAQAQELCASMLDEFAAHARPSQPDDVVLRDEAADRLLYAFTAEVVQGNPCRHGSSTGCANRPRLRLASVLAIETSGRHAGSVRSRR